MEKRAKIPRKIHKIGIQEAREKAAAAKKNADEHEEKMRKLEKAKLTIRRMSAEHPKDEKKQVALKTQVALKEKFPHLHDEMRSSDMMSLMKRLADAGVDVKTVVDGAIIPVYVEFQAQKQLRDVKAIIDQLDLDENDSKDMTDVMGRVEEDHNDETKWNRVYTFLEKIEVKLQNTKQKLLANADTYEKKKVQLTFPLLKIKKEPIG